jgi:hypothetical protein
MSILPLSAKDITAYAQHKFGSYFKGTFEIEDTNPDPRLVNQIRYDKSPVSVYLILLVKEGKNLGHWISLLTYHKNGKRMAYWYDPMGIQSAPKSIIHLFNKFKYNSSVVQKLGSDSCGLYALREAQLFLRPSGQYAKRLDQPQE